MIVPVNYVSFEYPYLLYMIFFHLLRLSYTPGFKFFRCFVIGCRIARIRSIKVDSPSLFGVSFIYLRITYQIFRTAPVSPLSGANPLIASRLPLFK